MFSLIFAESNNKTVMSSSQKVIKDVHSMVVANIQKAKSQLEMNEGCLVSHNSVVVFPETLLTISISATNEAQVNPEIIAAQFTSETAQRIASNVQNGRGDNPIVMGVRQYYQAQIESMTELLESITEA
jgi:hypothetical protein